MSEMNEAAPVEVKEEVVLSKFDGDGTDPSTEVERITVLNGTVVSHDVIENQEVVGPVEEDNLTGQDFGRLFPTE